MLLSEAMRTAILNCGLSVPEIAERTGIPNNNIYLFVRGKRGLSLESLDKIWDVLKLEAHNTVRYETVVRDGEFVKTPVPHRLPIRPRDHKEAMGEG